MIVGLAGYAGAGKDTAAQALVARGYRQDAFAHTLKQMALALNPWVKIEGTFYPFQAVIERYGWDVAKSFPDVREFLQRLGTEAVREHLGEDAWVKAVEERMERHWEIPYVLTDVRFENEAKFVASYSPHRIIWVERPGLAPVNGHASDQGLVRGLCTHEVVNDGDVAQLHQRILEVVGC